MEFFIGANEADVIGLAARDRLSRMKQTFLEADGNCVP